MDSTFKGIPKIPRIRKTGMSSPIIHNFLLHALAREASDLHLASGSPPTLRIHGQMERMEYRVLEEQHIRGLIEQIAPKEAIEMLKQGRAASFAYEMRSQDPPVRGRFRINVFPNQRGLSAAIRAIKGTPPRLKSLGMPPIVPHLTAGNHGLILVVGATGSGKSTTLAACVEELNQYQALHVITLEDPIEYVFQDNLCLIHQREVGIHTPSFTEGISDSLREDPDVIVIGEMRGEESMRLALIGAETGHLVFSTLHASSAPKAIERIIAAVPPEERDSIRTLLAETLRAVVFQKLIMTRDRKGRVAALEILVNNPAVATMIREGETHKLYATMQGSKKLGMQTMTEAIAALIRNNMVDVQDARSKAPSLKELDDAIAGRWGGSA